MYEYQESEEEVLADIKNRQRSSRLPRSIQSVVNTLLARTGYAQVKGNADLQEKWDEIAGAAMRGMTKTGAIKRGVLDIAVQNSAAMQELMFRKHNLVKELNEKLPGLNIRDIRFRVVDLQS